MDTAPQDRLYTTDELAEYLRRERSAIYWMRYRGLGPPAIRVGAGRGRLLFRHSDVEKWLAARADQSAQAS
jgi:hypothetical protein